MEHQKSLKFVFFIGAIIVAISILCIILLITIYRNKLYKIKRKESESLLNISLESEKKERKRIASDLHDSVSGDLSAVQNYITYLHNKESDSFKKEIFQEVELALHNTLKNIQAISYNLMPPMLESLGIVSTLKSYFERIRKWNNVLIFEEYLIEDIPIPASDSYEIYRIIQELVTNIIKHGKPDQITISVFQAESNIIFEILDNGSCFNFYKSVKEPMGMGLKNITSRIRYIHASLLQHSVAKGNKIQILINLKTYDAYCNC
ncbi:hypothetical protein GSF70_09920 [Flavobacteriaceae bacterium W22]|nr:hypothetical protein [Flavobacteriaceae bacterium W22]